MRELIRPTLFIIARTGLFLAVVAWTVGQWWNVSFLLPVPTGVAGAELSPESWQCRHVRRHFAIAFTDVVRTPHSSPGTEILHEKFRLMWEIEQIEASGRSAQSLTSTFHQVEVPCRGLNNIPHWLVVTALFTINIALHFTYRKRPAIQPCEN